MFNMEYGCRVVVWALLIAKAQLPDLWCQSTKQVIACAPSSQWRDADAGRGRFILS